jgi:hypothetical protein
MSLSKDTKFRLEHALTDKAAAEEVDAAIVAANKIAAAVADIADPATATAEDCANKINDLLASLRAAKLLAE